MGRALNRSLEPNPALELTPLAGTSVLYSTSFLGQSRSSA